MNTADAISTLNTVVEEKVMIANGLICYLRYKENLQRIFIMADKEKLFKLFNYKMIGARLQFKHNFAILISHKFNTFSFGYADPTFSYFF